MAILPTRILEIEFDTGVWTDVTADLVAISSRRGRNRESGAYETGQLLFTLRNDTRKYDPDNTAGTYYGKLRPNRRARWRNTYSATTYPAFVGYIDRISQMAGGPNDAVAGFQVSDFFKLLNRAELFGSVYEVEVLANTPRSWFRLDEPSGSTSVIDAIGGQVAGLSGSPTFGAAGLVTRDPGTAMQMPADAAGASRTGISIPATSTAAPTGTGDFSVEFIVQTTMTAPADQVPVLVQGESTPTEKFVVQLVPPLVGPFTRLFVQVASTHAGATSFGSHFTTQINDGIPHHVVVTRTAGVGRTYVDGVLDGFSPTYTLASDLRPDVLFGSAGTNVAFDWSFPGAVLDELAFYDDDLTAAQVLAHYNARRIGGEWGGDTPGARLARIFALVSTTATYSLDTGEPTLQATSLGGSVLAYAQKVEETTLGRLFVARDGTVTYVGRNTAVTGAYLTSKATLVDDDSGAGIPYRAADADVDESTIVTRATVSREGSTAVTVYDTAAKTEFGWLDETHDGLLHDSDAYSRGYAEWIVSTHKAPSSRVGAVALELTRDPTNMYPAILGLELGDRVTWKRKAQNSGAVVTIDMRVEAISHDTAGGYWRTTLQLSPFNLAAGLPVGVWDVTNWDQSVWGI